MFDGLPPAFAAWRCIAVQTLAVHCSSPLLPATRVHTDDRFHGFRCCTLAERAGDHNVFVTEKTHGCCATTVTLCRAGEDMKDGGVSA